MTYTLRSTWNYTLTSIVRATDEFYACTLQKRRSEIHSKTGHGVKVHAATGRTPNVGVTVTPLQLTPYNGVMFTLIME